jgi:hypothetical protein
MTAGTILATFFLTIALSARTEKSVNKPLETRSGLFALILICVNFHILQPQLYREWDNDDEEEEDDDDDDDDDDNNNNNLNAAKIIWCIHTEVSNH